MEVLQRTANRGSISTGYDIDNSLKLEADNSEYLIKTNDAGTNRKTFTVSMWFKRTELANDYMQLWQGGVFGEATRMGFYGGTPKEAIWVDVGGGTGNTGADYRSYSVQVARDTSAWYHIVLAVDTTQSTAADRLKVWLNGDEITTWTNQAIPAQDFQCSLEANIDMTWGAYNSTYYKMCGYIAECHYLDGVAKVQTDFGEYDEDSGIWKPKAYTGTYGGNGCYLNFDDSSNLGADSSGNGNDFTLNNITAADQATDTPTNNFCTWNPLWAYPNTATVGNGGTSSIGGASSVWRGSKGTIGLTNGKWYWEQKANGNDTIVGWQTENVISVTGTNAHNVNDTIALYEAGNYIWLRDETSGRNDTAVSGSYANGQIVGFALDLDSSPQTATFYRNGSAIASNVNIDGLTGKTIFPFTSHYQQTSNANFGGYTNISDAHTNTDENGYGAFVYTPPSGYYAICTKNLAEYG